jgi:hypothetical protein
LIVVDGVLQVFGVLDFAAAFLFLENRTKASGSDEGNATQVAHPVVRIVPTPLVPSGYGLTAVGNF